MASSGSDDNYSSTKDEITSINNQLQSVVTLTPSSDDPPSLSTLTVDLLVDILCRLPVKLLLQLRCICKLWNYLISHPKFAKMHLSTTRRRCLHLVSHTKISGKLVLASYPLDSIFTDATTNITKFVEYNEKYPRDVLDYIVGSCDGIVCLVDYQESAVLLWNPSIRKFKQLPPLKMPRVVTMFSFRMNYGFGYDHVSDNYKVVVAISYDDDYNSPGVLKTVLKVYTLGTNVWKTIQEEFPIGVELPNDYPVISPGKFVSGKINWLACKEWNEESSKCSIVSFDLGNESYQQVSLPDFREICDPRIFVLGVLRDCLCLIVRHDVWIMKEFGNKESWTKLFTVSYLRDPNKHFHLTKAVYIFEDDQVLLQSFGDWNSRLIVYDSRNSSFKFTKIASTPEVCVESLISPCSECARM